MRRLLLLLVPLTLLVPACGSDDPAAGGHDDHGAGEVAEGARTIEVTATSFAFDPDTIEADAGEDLAIELTADDIEHDFVLEEGDTHVVAAEASDTATGGFTAPDEAGEYTYYCSVAGHREAGMEGTLVVG